MSPRYALRPRRGEPITTGHGAAVVTAVREQGRAIDVRDHGATGDLG